jgi:hypothetical protein
MTESLNANKEEIPWTTTKIHGTVNLLQFFDELILAVFPVRRQQVPVRSQTQYHE